MSLVSLLSIARSALFAHQRAMTITGQNVANANTPGYSRQRVELRPADPQWLPEGTIGRGVDASIISRFRDTFADAAYRRESGMLGRSSQRFDMLSQIEGALGEPGDASIGATMDGLFTSFGDLANDPASTPNRAIVRSNASRLVDRIRKLDQQISLASQDSLDRMRAQAGEVNQITSQIAALNGQIVSGGGNAPDLADRRDALVDRLSSLMAVRVTAHADGSIAVTGGQALLVDGSRSEDIVVRALGAGFGVGLANSAGTFDPGNGSIAALSDLTTTTLPAYRARLDQLAQSLVTEVNAIHQTGFTLTGATGTNFFDPAGVTAATIALDAGVLASTDAIAAAATNAPGDGDLALRLAALLRTPVASLGGRTMRDHYVTFAGSIGLDVSDAASTADAQLALVDNADARRLSVSGVSVDEEMVNLIAQQQAYSAAARLVSAADEMMQDILRMV